MSVEGGNKAIVAALLANVGIAITKFIAFLLTGSSSRPSRAFSTTSVSAGWIQYCPRASWLTLCPKDIPWISGWISTDA